MPFKKFLLSFLVTSYLFLVTLTPSAFAADPLSLGDQIAAAADAIKPGQINSARWNYEFMGSTFMSIITGFIGENLPFKDFFDSVSKITSDGTGTIPKLQISGAFGQTTKMIAAVSAPPTASGVQYIASIFDNVTGKPAYAQGFGFTGLQFLLPLWKASTGIVNVLSSIVFVVIGLMIILRVKISPQAVVTVQSAVPQVITTLILVNFSYAIAGLVIDLSNIIAGLVFAVIFNSQGIPLTQNILPTLTRPSTFPIIGPFSTWVSQHINIILSYTGIAPLGLQSLVNPSLDTTTMLANRAAPSWFSLFLLSGQISSIITGVFVGSIAGPLGSSVFSLISVPGNAVVGVIGMLIIPIILCIMIMIWLIKLFFGLVKVYVTIILKIIGGPLEIAMGAFPNSKTGFSSWLLDVFANVMVFPIVMIFLVVLNILTDSISNSGAVWAPGMISTAFLMGPMLSACVGLAGLALISKLPEMIPQYIFMIKPSPWGDAIGKNLDPSHMPGSGFVKNTQAAFGKAQGEATLTLLTAGLNRIGIGARAPGNREHRGGGLN